MGNACPREFDAWRYTDWRWFWDYGGGTLTDLFSHWIDSVHWVMDDSVPVEVRGQGSKFNVDWFETPDTVASLALLYPKKFQVSYVSTMVTKMEDGGIIFRGTDGSLKLTRPFFEVYPESGPVDRRTYMTAPVEKVDSQRDGTVDHVLNWLDCVRTRKQPNAPVASSVDAANAAHWGNEAIRSGRALTVPPREAAWQPLFNGRNLDGWIEDTPNVWSVRDGMIVGRHAGQKWNDFLRTREWYEDFELSLEFRLLGAGTAGCSSGALMRRRSTSCPDTRRTWVRRIGAACTTNRGEMKSLAQAPAPAIAGLDKDGWHTYVIRALGNHITLTLDGMRTVDYTEPEAGIRTRGLIALQVHSGDGIEVWFRNLRLREL